MGSQPQQVLFVVFDKWARTPRVTAARDIAIVSPCTTAAAPFYCEEENVCSAAPCDARRSLLSSAAGTAAAAAAAERAQGPQLFLVDGEDATRRPAAAAALAAALTSAAVLTDAASAAAAGVNGTVGPLLYSSPAVMTVTLPYGRPAPYSLLPCGSVAAALSGCGAVAADATDGDLSASITVRAAVGASCTTSVCQ